MEAEAGRANDEGSSRTADDAGRVVEVDGLPFATPVCGLDAEAAGGLGRAELMKSAL
jgi:hypothetical protein